jgi:hypothetical protein
MVRDEPLPEIDEFILAHMAMVEELAEIMIGLASFDELRYEALLHAWPPGPNNDWPPEVGSYRAMFAHDRWQEVEAAMWADLRDWHYAQAVVRERNFRRGLRDGADERGRRLRCTKWCAVYGA